MQGAMSSPLPMTTARASGATTPAEGVLPTLSTEDSVPSKPPFIAFFPCFEGEPDQIQVRQLMLEGLAVLALFAGASFLVTGWSVPAMRLAPQWLRLISPALVSIALIVVGFSRPGRHWRWSALGFFIALALSYAAVAFLTDKDDELLLAFYAITVISALSLPWGPRWQAMLGLVSLISFTVAALTGIVDADDIQRWIILAVLIGFAVTFCALREYYWRQLVLVRRLGQAANKLQEENLGRRRIEERLRTEVEEREAAEHAARDREAMLRVVLNAGPDPAGIVDLGSGRFIDVNDEFLSFHGLTREQAVGKTPEDLNVWADPAEIAKFLETLKVAGGARNFETRLRGKNGRITDVLISATVTMLDGRLCAIGSTRDFTERKQMEQELIAAREAALGASRAKSEFLSSMSHEIRTPMNAVLGMAELLAESELSLEQRRYLEVMVANGNALLELINGIVDMAKIESGRMQIEKIEFDLTDLIEKTLSTFAVRAHGKGLELVARLAPGVPDRLVGDPLRLRQVLMNLVGNAIKFTELGEIVVSVEHDLSSQQAGDLVFSVSDTGIGIAPDKLESIFSSFTQADSSTTRKYGGSGLGLAIVKRLANLMNGRIWVDSEIGKGSRFSFAVSLGLAPRVISPTAHVVSSLAGYRMLVVDDNQTNRLIVREMLAGCGAEVQEAESGREALATIRQAIDRPFRVILLDMRMPEMDGLEVAKRIREMQLPLRPLILMLASDDLKDQIPRLHEFGLDAFLVKPIARRELFEAIHRVLEQANRESEPMPARPLLQTLGEPSNGKPSKPSARILVAEDAPDNRMVIAAYLSREPYSLDFAINGSEAVSKFTAQRYDLVLMDIQMPEMDGLTATRAIRQWERDNGADPRPIIALSASVLGEDVQRALAAGCNMHLAKPVKKRTLLDAIRKSLAAGGAPGQRELSNGDHEPFDPLAAAGLGH
jgi:two-component system, sensor histidine kinase and response regulator